MAGTRFKLHLQHIKNDLTVLNKHTILIPALSLSLLPPLVFADHSSQNTDLYEIACDQGTSS